MNRSDKVTAVAGVAACAVCCAPLILGPLSAVGALIIAGAGTVGVSRAATSDAPTWLLAILAVLVLAATIGMAYAIAGLVRRQQRLQARQQR